MNTYKDIARREPVAGRDIESGDKELGVRIWRIMRKKGMNQSSLSEASGVSKNVITRLLTGRRMTSFTNIEKIATALDVSLDEFRPPLHRPRKEYAGAVQSNQVREVDAGRSRGGCDPDMGGISLYK
ncbi:helix-turn-helix domain-containing protein [Collinsella sp. AF38-3AC]|uniref:helix-turn-helix domain-containing protein n=1 Tax=Collinsella sp. AF38-3AC TaxID=2292015 RepID=UPI00131413A9|nr:helix-turn-helix transcriptional regulator [Collinsella sp. AF38-3AC]